MTDDEPEEALNPDKTDINEICVLPGGKKEADVRFHFDRFMKVFTYQILYFGLLGPFTPLLMLLTEGNFNLADNMCLTLRGIFKYFLI